MMCSLHRVGLLSFVHTSLWFLYPFAYRSCASVCKHVAYARRRRHPCWLLPALHLEAVFMSQMLPQSLRPQRVRSDLHLR